MGERLADLLAGLSRFADLGFGLPAGTSLRSGVLAVRLARALGGSEAEAGAAFWTARDSPHEHRLGARSARQVPAHPDRRTPTAGAGQDRGGRPHARGGVGKAFGTAACEVGRAAGMAAQFDALGGPDLAVAAVRERSGGMLDPSPAGVFVAFGTPWLAELAASDPREAALAEEPGQGVRVTDLRPVAEVFGDLADLKSPCFTGHSRRVASLAERAARELRLSDAQVSDLAVAGHLHDVGRVAVSSGIWDKAGALTPDEWEQARLHPYHTERILAGSPALARLGPLAGHHHERLDGSGYFRGAAAAEQSQPARVLAAADCLATASEPRPHRPALTPDQAASKLRAEAGHDRLDADAVEAVLAAAGHATPSRGRRAGTLSEREVEVLRLVAHGSSNARIAERLVISRRTAEHHVQHVYAKIGVSSRAAATLYAVEHHLLDG